MTAIRIHDEDAVRRLVLCRPDEYNTITVELRDELDAALEQADRDRVREGRFAQCGRQGVLRRFRARLVDARSGEPRRRRAIGFGTRWPMSR